MVLEGSHGLGGRDPGERAATVEQYEKDRDALYERLARRWGETDPYNLQTVLLRTEREEIPEPWAALSARARVGTSLGGRRAPAGWVAVAVADRDETDEVRLLAVVTQEAPTMTVPPTPARVPPPRPAAGRTPPPSSAPSSAR
ncbi:hypothetical protein SVIOM342S_08874 [Streptomyces violaceorubidus]